ncbi:pyridoxamine 5'-phosphate oxidase family protein [Enterococcus hirae]|nr:pyridoxamine 5'-phosphate oxidase family protein [Enterococcus hirae]
MDLKNETLQQVLKHEGVVSIITLSAEPTAIGNTWISYLHYGENDEIYIPVAGMHTLEAGMKKDNHIALTLGSKEVQGTQGPGAGFHITGTGEFITSGPIFDKMKTDFPWITRVLVVNVTDVSQKI